MLILLFICIILIVFIMGVYLQKRSLRVRYFRQMLNINTKSYGNEIPKIIHQTAPSDRRKWPKVWTPCYNSWKVHFPESEFDYIFWDDNDLARLIKSDFPWFWSIYNSYPQHIKRVDIARYFILYKYGGIYVDMDYMCLKNFYKKLKPGYVSVVESPYKKNEKVQNALMCSPPGHDFWKEVIIKGIERRHRKNVLDCTGPRLLDAVIKDTRFKIDVLPQNYYNPHYKSRRFLKDRKLYCKHLLTNVYATGNKLYQYDENKNFKRGSLIEVT